MTAVPSREPAGEQTASRRAFRPAVAVAVGAIGAFTWLGGYVGFFGGVAMLAALLATSPRYAFAVGQIALVAATGGAVPNPAGLAAAQILLLAVLVAPEAGRSFEPTTAAATLAATAGLSGIAWASLAAWGATWMAAVVVLAVAGLVGYGVHRYELVALGNVQSATGGADR